MDEETNRLLQQLLNAVQQSGGRQTPDVQKANAAYTKHVALIGLGNIQEGKRQSLVSKGLVGVQAGTKATLKLAQSFENASTAMRENREKFQSLDGTIDMAASGMRLAGKTAGIAVSGLAQMGKIVPGVGGAIAGLGDAAGKMVAALGEIGAEIVSQVGKTFTKELDRITGSFRTVAQVGAVGADGMSGLAKQAINAGLSFESFGKVVAKESANLSFAFGTSAQAARGLSDTTKAMRPFREQLLTLGVGVEQQNELTAKYIVYQQRSGRQEVGNAQQLAQGSQAYIKNLTTLSKITGKSIDETQKAQDALSRDVRKGAALREIERKSGIKAKEATEQTILTLQNLPGTKILGDGLADALAGAGTDSAKAFLKATGSIGPQVISQLKAGEIDPKQALAMIQSSATNFYKALGGDASASMIGGLDTAVANILESLQTLALTKDLGQAAADAAKETTKLAKTQDGLTKDIVAAQESMIKSATALDAIALDKILPLAGSAVKSFTDMQLTATNKIASYLDTLTTKGIEAFKTQIADDAKAGSKTLMKIADEDSGGMISSVTNWFEGIGDKLLNTLNLGLGGAAVGAAIGGPIALLTSVIGGAIGTGFGVYKNFIQSDDKAEDLKLAGVRAEGAAVESQDAANKKLMTPLERAFTGMAESIEWLVGGLSKTGENFLQAARVGNQTNDAIDEGRMKKSDVVQGYKLQARAGGGSAQAGKDYLVGENGPEILKMGKTSGVVIPGQMGPGVPGRTPGTFDVKLGDGTKVTVDAKGNELHRSTPTIGGLSMSSFADGSVSGQYQTTVGNVNMTRDYIGGAGVSGDGIGGMREAGLGVAAGPVSAYQSGKLGGGEGVASLSYGMGNGITMNAQTGASGGQFDALGQLRSTAGPNSKFGNAGGLSIDNQGLKDIEGGPAAGQTQTMHAGGAGNEKIISVLQAMLDQNRKAARLQGEQLQATRNN